MRGKDTPAGAASPPAGITPAYAGKSIYDGKQCKLGRDHPRLCGEKYFRCTLFEYMLRITPAYAGKRMLATEINEYD